jgi:SAM-dependent methyltransferase
MTGLKLLLGCGHEDRRGWVHHDLLAHSQHIQVAHDLEIVPWPWDDNSAEAIAAIDVLEHLADTVAFMDECWRILEPGGQLMIQVPDYRSQNAWIDPTHRRAFHPDTFQYFNLGSGQWNSFGHLYTTRPWRVLSLDAGDNITCVLMPVKA